MSQLIFPQYTWNVQHSTVYHRCAIPSDVQHTCACARSNWELSEESPAQSVPLVLLYRPVPCLIEIADKMAGLERKVRQLLDLLDEVERGFLAAPQSIQPALAQNVMDRLLDVHEVIAVQYEEDADSQPQPGADSQVICAEIDPVDSTTFTL